MVAVNAIAGAVLPVIAKVLLFMFEVCIEAIFVLFGVYLFIWFVHDVELFKFIYDFSM